ncbi:YbdK family carboxylate-amine ligase [Paludisphaera sp.]|uniref:carboxylate-amine ligase n=1 Tax=Paludisphaera sp. TaxID=2017432 RepID=UPI00301D7C41
MEERRFACSANHSVGVELELQVLHPRSLALVGSAAAVLGAVPEEYRRSIKPEYYDCCIEVATDVCRDVDQAGRDLRDKLTVAGRAASRAGALLGWGGTHPFSHWAEAGVFPTPRYAELKARYGDTLQRQLTFGLHVHVGVGDGDAAARACSGIVEHLPALLALSADSPFWCGRRSGLQSKRIEVMEASPSSGPPPRLRCWEDYDRLVGRLASAGLIESEKELWWDARPSPENGTVEVRVCDMPLDLDSALALTALIQCLVVDLSRRRDEPADDECAAAAARQNRWRAARFGLGAEFADARTGRRESAAQAVRRLAGRLRDVAGELGCVDWLDRVATMAERPNGAERQVAAHERSGSLAEVVRARMIPDLQTPRAPWGPPAPGAFGTSMIAAAIRPA